TATEQIAAIRVRVQELIERQSRAFVRGLVPELRRAGFSLVGWEDLSDEERDHLETSFRDRVFPVLTPLSVDPAHPFPYISNLSLNLAVMVRDAPRRQLRFARVKVPPLLPRFVALPDGHRFITLEQVIALHLQALFPGMDVVSHHAFRVTRDADLELVDEEAADLLATIQSELRRLQRKAAVVRLEVEATMTDEVLGLLMRELELEPTDVYKTDGLLDLSALWALYGL